MNVETENDRKIIIAAFQYALGRKTSIEKVVVDELVKNWGNLYHEDKQFIHLEIRKAKMSRLVESPEDYRLWNKISSLPD